MKYMTGKAKMMVTGIALGTVAAGGMAALIAAGKVKVNGHPVTLGDLVVVFLMALAGVSGWMIGIQMRVKIEHDRAWMKGYRDGRESSLPPITVTTERMLIRYRENPGL